MSVSIRKGHVDFLKTMEKSLENNRASKTPPLNALKDSTFFFFFLFFSARISNSLLVHAKFFFSRNLALSNSLKDSAPDKKGYSPPSFILI